jgi:hypothetical protein
LTCAHERSLLSIGPKAVLASYIYDVALRRPVTTLAARSAGRWPRIGRGELGQICITEARRSISTIWGGVSTWARRDPIWVRVGESLPRAWTPAPFEAAFLRAKCHLLAVSVLSWPLPSDAADGVVIMRTPAVELPL